MTPDPPFIFRNQYRVLEVGDYLVLHEAEFEGKQVAKLQLTLDGKTYAYKDRFKNIAPDMPRRSMHPEVQEYMDYYVVFEETEGTNEGPEKAVQGVSLEEVHSS